MKQCARTANIQIRPQTSGNDSSLKGFAAWEQRTSDGNMGNPLIFSGLSHHRWSLLTIILRHVFDKEAEVVKL